MDDSLQIIIYIVFLAIYFLSRALRGKNKPAPGRPQREVMDREDQHEEPMTFEDLLKEITTGKKIERPSRPVPEPKKEFEFKEELPDDEEIQKVYEDSVKKARQMKLGEKIEMVPEVKFKGYEDMEPEENTFATEIRDMLRNPEDARKAIILKEILDRKF